MESTTKIGHLVTVIMPSYNAEEFIGLSIDSVLLQTHCNLELIIIDDRSSDNTRHIVREKAKEDQRITLISLRENMGAAYARNEGIAKSNGSYIAFCDADDLWYPDKLAIQLRFMLSRGLSFTCSGYDVIDKSGQRQGFYVPSPKATYFRLKYANFIGCLTVIYDKRVHGHLRMPDIRSRQDYALWLEIFKQIKVSENVTQRLAAYRLSKGSLSSNYLRSARNHYRVLRYVHGVNRIESLIGFCTYAINALIKRLKYILA